MSYNKYRVAQKNERTYNNIVFASKKEMNRYKELLLLEKSGNISGLELQPKYILQETFYHNIYGKQRDIYYIADFRYLKNNVIIVEDVKGMKNNPVYLIKRKMLLLKYPDINFIET